MNKICTATTARHASSCTAIMYYSVLPEKQYSGPKHTWRAFSHCPPLSQAEMAALVIVVSGRTPSTLSDSNT